MWSWSLNWDEITPRIVVGSCPMSPHDIDRIRDDTGATALLCLQHDECLAHFHVDLASNARRCAQRSLALVRSPIPDFDVDDMRRRLPEAVRALTRLLREGYRVYVHCTSGIGRSPLVVLGYLTFVEGQSLVDAERLIRERRADIAPNLDAYETCRQDLVAQYGERITARAWELSQQARVGDAGRDWQQAEMEILREVFFGGAD